MLKFDEKLKFDRYDLLELLAAVQTVQQIAAEEPSPLQASDLENALDRLSDKLSDLITNAIESMFN